MIFHIIQHPPRAAKGIAEIFIEGGEFSYIKKTCVCRIYQKHLGDSEAQEIVSRIAKALNATIEKE